MSKFIQMTLLFVSLISTAMQCDNGTLKIAQEIDLRVNPNPIPIENHRASFEITTTLPAIRTLKKVDSLIFEVSYQKGDQLLKIGTTKMMIPRNWNAATNLYDTATFKLTNFSVPDQTTLYFQMNMYKNGRMKTTVPLAVSHFENKDTEF